jgi:hypothetical protein
MTYTHLVHFTYHLKVYLNLQKLQKYSSFQTSEALEDGFKLTKNFSLFTHLAQQQIRRLNLSTLVLAYGEHSGQL